jgi:chromosome segregation ATPase
MNLSLLLKNKYQQNQLLNHLKIKIMKKMMLLVSVSLLIAFSSCNNNKEQIAKLKTTNDSLLSLGYQKDTTVIAYVAAFNSIQANLDSIKGKEMIISKSTKGGGELKQDAKDQINQDIKSIYELLQKNRRIVAGLKSKLKKSNVRIVELEKMIETLNAQIVAKDADIAQMKADLEKLNIKVAELNTSVDNLSAANQSKAQTIDEQTKALHTAYYVIGTAKELKAHNVITKEGGFAGLGRNKKLKEDFNKEYFTRVDITTFKGLAIAKKKVSVITNHPKTAYKLTGAKTIDSLVIKNPAEFWISSKYLVVIAE